MKGTAEVIKGRIEEAAGALLDNEKLRDKGQKDQALGHIKQTAEKGVARAKKLAKTIVVKAEDIAQQAIDKEKSI